MSRGRPEAAIGMSGFSLISLVRGLAEGGYLGALLYPLIPDKLARTLEASGTGAAVNFPGDAQPVPRTTAQLTQADESATWRIPLFLHADDQAIPASSSRQAQIALDEASSWA